ncbi:MAG: hypothetical protein AB1898_19800 [Acidobacteriota bacterium]
MKNPPLAQFAKPLSWKAKLKKQWWVFLVPLYPLAWLWVLTFWVSLWIDEPLRWNRQNFEDQTYTTLELLPYQLWSTQAPIGQFSGPASNPSPSGIVVSSDVWEVWFAPVYFQFAKRLTNQVPLPPSAFWRGRRVTEYQR